MSSFWIYVRKLIYKLVDNFSVQFIRLKRKKKKRVKIQDLRERILIYTYMMEALHNSYL